VDDGAELVGVEADPRDDVESCGASRRGVFGIGAACLYNEHCAGVRDVGFGGGGSVPGEEWAGDALSPAEAIGLGPAHDWVAGEDRGGVEEEGEEGERGVVGGDAEDGEAGAVADRVR